VNDSAPDPNVGLREIAAVLRGTPVTDLAAGDRYDVATIVWDAVGQDFDAGIALVARQAHTTPDHLLALLAAEGVHEAQRGERGIRVFWLEALLILAVLLGVALLVSR
jgi:hypothetical protein